MKNDASYLCGLCQKNRYIKIDLADHEKLIAISNNGLAQISDIHHCAKGMLSINNLHVDHNLHVRSFSHMELPDKKRVSSLMGIPMPTQQSSINTYRITKMYDDRSGYRLRLMDDRVRIAINIGLIDKNEEPEAIFISHGKSVRLEFFNSDLPLRKHTKAWFQKVVNVLEELPPTRLGLFIEALRYVSGMDETMPSDFEVQQLRTLLLSHKTTFTILPHTYKSLRNISNKYGNDKRETIDKMMNALREHPDSTLQELQAYVKADLIYMIYLAILLELEGVLDVHRDDTIEEI